MSQKQDAGWIRAAFVLMLLVGGANALLGGLGIARIFPLYSDEFMGYEESVRNLALGLVMLVLAVLMMWRRAVAAPAFATAIFGVAFVVFLLPDPNEAATTTVSPANSDLVESIVKALDVWVPIVRGVFTLFFVLLMGRAVVALRREAAQKVGGAVLSAPPP